MQDEELNRRKIQMIVYDLRVMNKLFLLLLIVSFNSFGDRLSDIQDSLEDIQIEMDYQRMLRMLEQQRIQGQLIPKVPQNNIPARPNSSNLRYLGKNSTDESLYIHLDSIFPSTPTQIEFTVQTYSEKPQYYGNITYFETIKYQYIDCSKNLITTKTLIHKDNNSRPIDNIFVAKDGLKFRNIKLNKEDILVKNFLCR
jgi:hypothetical protein